MEGKENAMKNVETDTIDGARVALWTGISLGLGIVVHRIFFLVALAIALSTPFGWLVHRLREAGEHAAPNHKHA